MPKAAKSNSTEKGRIKLGIQMKTIRTNATTQVSRERRKFIFRVLLLLDIGAFGRNHPVTTHERIQMNGTPIPIPVRTISWWVKPKAFLKRG
jgi:hypothetical protein